MASPNMEIDISVKENIGDVKNSDQEVDTFKGGDREVSLKGRR